MGFWIMLSFCGWVRWRGQFGNAVACTLGAARVWWAFKYHFPLTANWRTRQAKCRGRLAVGVLHLAWDPCVVSGSQPTQALSHMCSGLLGSTQSLSVQCLRGQIYIKALAVGFHLVYSL